jgi:hypothetical protein
MENDGELWNAPKTDHLLNNVTFLKFFLTIPQMPRRGRTFDGPANCHRMENVAIVDGWGRHRANIAAFLLLPFVGIVQADCPLPLVPVGNQHRIQCSLPMNHYCHHLPMILMMDPCIWLRQPPWPPMTAKM